MKTIKRCGLGLALALGWAGGNGVSQAAEPAGTPAVEQVIVVFKTHFDIGYTDLASNVVQRYRTTMIDEALKVVDANQELPPEQQFAWTLPGWPLAQIEGNWPGQDPGRQERVRSALRQGRFVVHALPFTTHTELLELEDLVRGLTFSSRLARAVDLPLPRDAKMTDVPCHAWILPTLLRRAGVDFLHLGCNAASRSPEVPRLFWWEGPDGSRLLTMYTAESYGTGLVPPKAWPYKVWLALIHTGDNHGPPTPEEVQKVLAEANEKLPGVRVRIGRLSDFADALRATPADIPVVRGDMPDTWIHGPMSDPDGAAMARNGRPHIATTEFLNTCLRGWGAQPPALGDAVAAAYEQSLLYGEHTWGGALYWVTRYEGDGPSYPYGNEWATQRAEGRFDRLEASWEEHTDYVRGMQSLVKPALQAQLQALAGAVRHEGPRLVVFNPLPWKRDGLVRLAAPELRSGWLRAVDTGALVRAWPRGGEIWFRATEVPAMGYRTYVPAARPLKMDRRERDAVSPEVASDSRFKRALWDSPPMRLQRENATVENAFFKVTADPERGGILSILDKRSGRELVEPNAPHAFGSVLYERFSSNQVAAYVDAYVKIQAAWATNELGKPALPPAKLVPYRAAGCSNAVVRSEQTPGAASLFLQTPLTFERPFAVTTCVTLYPDEDYVDLTVAVAGKPADPWPEAGWLCLPFKVDEPRFRVGRQGSVVDPATDLVVGANRNLLAVNSGVMITDAAGRGVGFCAVDSPLVSLDLPGGWRYDKNFVPQKPRAYVNLFNNQWTTNFRLWNSGSWLSRVRLWSVRRGNAGAELVRPSWEARQSLVAAWAEGAPGKLPLAARGVEISRPGVLVTAFGPNPDGAGVVLRLWECAGSRGPCDIRLPAEMKVRTVQPCDLRGQPTGPAFTPKKNTWSANLSPFAPASYVLMPAQ